MDCSWSGDLGRVSDLYIGGRLGGDVLYMIGFLVRVKVVVSLCDVWGGLMGGSFLSNCEMVDVDVESEVRGCLRKERNLE